MGNSLFVASIEVTFQVISAAMIAYALTQFKFKGEKVVFAMAILYSGRSIWNKVARNNGGEYNYSTTIIGIILNSSKMVY